MKQMFSFALVFNQNISTWNVSNVTNMSGMFRSPLQWITDGFNQNLSSWSVTNVTNCTQFSYRAVQYILPKPNFTNCTP
jgi:surface protein